MTSRTAACAIAGLILLTAGTAAIAQPGEGGHVRPDGHVLLAWLHGGSSDDYRAQAERMPGVSVLSPTWWALDALDLGGIIDEADPDLAAWAGEQGLAVWPQLSNRLDSDLAEEVLSDADRRGRLVRQSAQAVERAGAGGLVVGFENLHEETGPGLTAFVRDLRSALPGRVVAVTVAPHTATWSRGSWSTAYERGPLGEVADYLLLTALDQHDGAGPVAGLEWTLETVEHLLRSVPEDKVLLTVPLYARDWIADPTAPGGGVLDSTLGMDDMAERLASVDAKHEHDPVAGQRRYTYTGADGRVHHVWQEDPPSLARRAQLATAYNLGGVAGWRAGFAGPEAWEALSTALAADPRPPGPASGPPRLNRLVPVPLPADPAPEAAAGEQEATLETAGRAGEPTGVGPKLVALTLLASVAGGLVATSRLRLASAPRAGERARR